MDFRAPAQLRPQMNQGGDVAARHLVPEHPLQFHAHHVQPGDAPAGGEELALARHHGGEGS